MTEVVDISPATFSQRGAVCGAAVTVLTALVTLSAWAMVIPPFEAPDEIFVSNLAVAAARGEAVVYDPLYFALAGPLLRIVGDPRDFEARRNPSFRFVSNRRGEVNMFVRASGAEPAPDLSRVYILRALSVAVTTVTVVLIYVMALWSLERWHTATAVACAAVFVPQFAFMGAVAHPEVVSTLWGAVACTALLGRLHDRLPRRVALPILVLVLASTPFVDNAAFFLAGFVPLALFIVERGTLRWLAVGLVAAAVGLLAAIVIVHDTAGAATRELLRYYPIERAVQIVKHPLAPFLTTRDVPQYFLFEFTPKLFFGFWGWLGQPSVLLPSWAYASLAVVTVAGVAGCLVVLLSRGRTDVASRQRRLVSLTVVGLVCMLVPIAYANVLWHRDAWYGRWLFPLMGPIVIAFAIGLGQLARAGVRRPNRFVWVATIAALAIAALWVGPAGAEVENGIQAHHYGDQPHLRWTLHFTAVGLLVLPVILIVSRTFGIAGGRLAPLAMMAVCGALNAAVLFGFIRPLYAGLDAAGYLAQIDREVARGELPRAAALAEVAHGAFPSSTQIHRRLPGLQWEGGAFEKLQLDDARHAEAIRRLMSRGENKRAAALAASALARLDGSSELRGVAARALLETGEYDALRAALDARMARRGTLDDGEALALARLLKMAGWKSQIERERLSKVGDAVQASRGTVVPGLCVNLSLGRYRRNEPEAASLLVRAGATAVDRTIAGRATIRAAKALAMDGRVRLIVFFRPLREWQNATMWVHAYPPGLHEYIDVPPAFPPIQRWRTDELAWEVFELPAGRVNVYVGVSADGDLGPAVPLGWMGGGQ